MQLTDTIIVTEAAFLAVSCTFFLNKLTSRTGHVTEKERDSNKKQR